MRLGEIQGIQINSEGHDVYDLETIWFIQDRTVNITLKKLQRRNYKISDALIKVGFEIPNPEQFDLDLRILFEYIITTRSIPSSMPISVSTFLKNLKRGK